MDSLPPPWRHVAPQRSADAREREALEAELGREVAAGHPLWGRSAVAVARCVACDEVVFRVGDAEWAIVHLTWSGRTEEPPWPRAQVCASGEALDARLAAHEH